MRGGLPVAVHIEADPSLIHAGSLNWDGYSYVVPQAHADWEPPTTICREWKSAIWPLGALDAYESEIVVTIQGLDDAAVLIDGFRVHIESREPLTGVVLRCPVGGADGMRRGFVIDLDMGGVYFDLNASWEEGDKMPRSFTVGKGETESFHVLARASNAAYRWTAEFLLVIDGKREIVDVTDDGDPFRTAGAEGLPEQFWWGDHWGPME